MKITIGIPTFNRCEYLDNLLNSIYIAYQFRKIDSLVIYISDNNSNDDTYKVVKKWSDRLKIIYRKNISNLGAVKNLISTIQGYQGDGLFWFMGDDDEIVPNAFQIIDQLASKYEDDIDIILANRYICKQKRDEVKILEGKVDQCFYKNYECFSINNHISFSKYIDNVKNCAGIFGLISSVLVSANIISYISRKIKDDDIWYNNLFPHVYLLFCYISESYNNKPVNILFNSTPAIKHRAGLVTKGTGSDKLNTLIDFEHLYEVGSIACNNTYIFNSFIKMLRRFYTYTIHLNAINSPSVDEKKYHNKIMNMLFTSRYDRFYYTLLSKLLIFYKVYKYFKK